MLETQMVAVCNISHDMSANVSCHDFGKLIGCLLINTFSLQSNNVVAVSFGAFIQRSSSFNSLMAVGVSFLPGCISLGFGDMK